MTSERKAKSRSNRLEQAWNTCGHCGKRGYKTRSSAREAARRQRQQADYDPAAAPLHIYRCRSGNRFYHLGHNKMLGPDLNDPKT